MIFLLELLIKRCNSRYGRTRLVGKQSDASFFFGDGLFVEHGWNFLYQSLRWEPKRKRFSMEMREQELPGGCKSAKRIAGRGVSNCPLLCSLI